MHIKTFLFFVTASFAVLTSAHDITTTITATAPPPTATTISQCNAGHVSCCSTVENSSSKDAAAILGLLGIALGHVTGLVGLGCTPILPIVSGGENCNAHLVCCTNTQFSGLINLGCNNISL